MDNFNLLEYLKEGKLLEAMMACPLPTQDLELNTKNRNSAIEADYIQYGPLNLNDEEYWERAAKHWNTTVDVAKQSKCKNCVAFDISERMLQVVLLTQIKYLMSGKNVKKENNGCIR